MRGHLSTRVCDLLDCKYPVVLAGMGGVARSELVLGQKFANQIANQLRGTERHWASQVGIIG